MADIDVGKFGKKSGIDLSTFTGGLKKDQMKTDAQKSIFDKLDTDKNGVLDENEISAFRSAVDSNGDNTVSKREAKRFLKDKDLKNIDKKDLLAFLQNYNINTENVESTQVISKNGQDIVQITYKDGSIEQINPDKSSQITQTDQNGYTKTSFLDENKKLLKDFVTTKEGNTIEIEYAQDGKTPVHSVAVNKENGSVVTTDYENGKPSTKQVKTGTTTSNYTFDEQGNAVITSKIENEGIPAKERRTEYKYNDDGTVTENITENGKTTERLRKGDTIILENITENGKVSKRTYYEKGYEEETTDSNGNPVVNVYSLENKKLAQQKTVDGKQYSVLYDGEGNTRTIVQNGESLQSIADKFGCSVEDLKELNADVLNGKKYFPVGAEIKIPGELEADAPSLQNRKSAVEAKAEYARDEQIRAQKRAERAALDAQYKSMGLINYKGQGGKITGTWKGGSKEEFTIIGEAGKGRHLAKGKDGKIVTISHDGVILKDEYVQLTNLYSSGDKIQGKITVINEDGSRTLQTRNYVEIEGADLPHGRKAVVDGKGKVYVMSNDGIILDNNYVARSNYADSIRGDKTTAQAATVDMLTQQIDSAQAAFDVQMKEDGWAADVADGISNIWGIFQEDGNQAWRVREDLAQYRKDMDALKTAAKQGDSQFRAKFKQMFGVDYNQNAIADYMMNPTSANYQKAFGTKNNIGERVAKYNESQQTGAAVVKGAATVTAGVAIGITTGGTGLVALGAAAAATTASSVAINASDRLSSEVGLKEGEMGQIFENALWDGASVLAGGAVGKVAQTTIKGVSTAATVTRSAANAAGDVAMGAAQEYAQTGEVTLGGTALNAALGTVGMAAESGVLKRAGQKIKGVLHKGESTSAQGSFQNPAAAQLSGAELKDGSMMVKPQGTKSVETSKSEFRSETPAQSAEMSKSPSNNNVPENNASENSASQVESKSKYTEEFEPHYEKQEINGEIIDKRLNPDNSELKALHDKYNALEEKEIQIKQQVQKLKAQIITNRNNKSKISADIIDQQFPTHNSELAPLHSELRALELKNEEIKRQVADLKLQMQHKFELTAADIDAKMNQRTGDYEDLVSGLKEREAIGLENDYIRRTYEAPSGKSAQESAAVFQENLLTREQAKSIISDDELIKLATTKSGLINKSALNTVVNLRRLNLDENNIKFYFELSNGDYQKINDAISDIEQKLKDNGMELKNGYVVFNNELNNTYEHNYNALQKKLKKQSKYGWRTSLVDDIHNQRFRIDNLLSMYLVNDSKYCSLLKENSLIDNLVISDAFSVLAHPSNYKYTLTDNPDNLIELGMKYFTTNIPSSEARDALGAYKGLEFNNINTSKDPYWQKQAAVLEDYLSDSPIEFDMRVRRDDASYNCLGGLRFDDGTSLAEAIKNPEFKYKLSEVSLLKGKSFVNERFMSTTADKGGTIPGCLVSWNYTVKKGTGAAFLDSVGINKEKEFLVNRNSKITIEDIQIIGENEPLIKIKATVEPATLNVPTEANSAMKVVNSASSNNVSLSTPEQGQSSAAIDVPEVNPVPSPNVKQSITGSVDGSDNLLKTANLDDDKIQAELLAMLEKEIPSSRRVPGRVKTLKELQTLVNNPSYAQLDEAGKRMAKIAILKSNQRLDSRALYDDLNVSIEVKRKINTFEKSMTSPETAAALYNDNDFAALILVAKSKGVDEATIAKMQEAYNKAKNNGSLLVHKTDINVSNIPVRQVAVDGKSFNVKVVDCTDDAVFAHPELYGLPAGTTADNIRLTVHMNDGFNKAPQMTIGKMRQSEDLNLSASVTDGKNTLYDNQQIGIVLDYDMGAVSYASNYAAGTGFCKTNTDFAKSKLDLNNPSKGTFIRDQFVERMKAQGYDISAEDYAAFSSKLSGKNDIQTELRKLAVNGQIDFNGKQIPVEQVEKVLFESTDDLMHVSYEMRGIKVENGFNEVNVYNPEIKAIYVRGNSADDTIESILSADLLNYAQRRNLPIIFQRCVIKS